MVYRGKPSAGCENCRKAKKRCGLEQPACQRCVKLRKPCSGYRDISQLQIQDETLTVRLKAERKQAKQSSEPPHMPAVKCESHDTSCVQTPTDHDRLTESADLATLPIVDLKMRTTLNQSSPSSDMDINVLTLSLPVSIRPVPEDLATNCFYETFTATTGHYRVLRDTLANLELDPCLQFAMRACGMAALDNTRSVVMGQQYARTMYAEALSLLNNALQDPERWDSDETLLAVSLLGYFENLTCDSRQSIHSWKSHVRGASQLLKMRGKSQFKSPVSRMLYREIRTQRMIQCLWDDEMAPEFFREYQPYLVAASDDEFFAPIADTLVDSCTDFAAIQHKMKYEKITDTEALVAITDLEADLIHWSSEAVAHSELWRYYELDVPESPHIWKGTVHGYTCNPVPMIWNTWRVMRIIVTRTQELLYRRMSVSEQIRREQMQYILATRREMTDQICAAVPVCLGHSAPAFTSRSVLLTAYTSIWPLFFAGTCALERVGPGAMEVMSEGYVPTSNVVLDAWTQTNWIVGRLEFIAHDVGLRWAKGIAATIRGNFEIYEDLLTHERRQKLGWTGKLPAEERRAWSLQNQRDAAPFAGTLLEII